MKVNLENRIEYEMKFDADSKAFLVIGLTLSVLALLVSCAAGPKFAEVKGKDWKLVEVQIHSSNPPSLAPNTIAFDRRQLANEGSSDIFVLNFGDSGAIGKAAPADYSAPYDLSPPQTLTFRELTIDHDERSIVPERLREAEYFEYLKKISRWAYTGGRLELYSADTAGNEVIMFFAVE
jgi:hypothetical protein